MKITVLLENTLRDECLTAEHGLSLYLETEKHRILFDMGQTDAFAQNAQQLGINLQDVDIAVLSHGHYDHGGGISRFLELNEKAPVYLSAHAFGPHYHGEDKYIGLDTALQGSGRLRFVEEDCILDDTLSLHACSGAACAEPIESYGLTVHTPRGFEPETFRHEQYLLIREKGKKILISGCSHRGILNIVRWFEPDVLIGGFHLMKLDPAMETHKETLSRLADELLRGHTQYYTGHCTGAPAYAFLKERMGDRLDELYTGLSVHAA